MATVHKANDMADNVEYVAFAQHNMNIRSLVLVKPEDAPLYYLISGQAVAKIYWRSGKWSSGFAIRDTHRAGSLASIWVGNSPMNGVKLFDITYHETDPASQSGT